MINGIIGQALGYVAMALFALSYQIKKNLPLMVVQTVGTLCFCISYLFLGRMDGFALNIICVIRNVSFCILKPQTRLSYTVTGLLMTAMAVVSVFAWEGPLSLLISLPLIINTFFLSLGKPQVLRKSVVFTSTGLLLYNVFVKSPGGILSEGISIVSSIIGIIRYRKVPTDESPSEVDPAKAENSTVFPPEN